MVDVAIVPLVLLGAMLAFTLSASAGLGGSLILVPLLVALIDVKEGIALAALMLTANNVAKVIVYRKTIPFKAALWVVVLTIVGAVAGARVLVQAPEKWIHFAVIASIGMTFLFEIQNWRSVRLVSAPILALFSGGTSGVSGTSGPLKGIALRSLDLKRAYLVGAASLVSFAGDLSRSLVYVEGIPLDRNYWLILIAAIPLMPIAVLLGRRINQQIGERAYAGLFWTVMAGYTARLTLS